MRLSYSTSEPGKDVQALAKELVRTIIETGMTYRKAMEALECARRLLETETRPVRRPCPESA